MEIPNQPDEELRIKAENSTLILGELYYDYRLAKGEIVALRLRAEALQSENNVLSEKCEQLEESVRKFEAKAKKPAKKKGGNSNGS